MAFPEPDWAWLPEGIVMGILNCIVSFYDCARFGAVCKHWYSIAKDQYLINQFPLLMIPSINGDKDERSLYNVMTGKTYNLQVKLHYDRKCCGYSHGWLATIDENIIITLRNPFSSQTIPLPPIEYPFAFDPRDFYGYEYAMHKVLLSHNPYMHPDSCEVVVMYGARTNLALLKPGSESWIYLDEIIPIDDIIYYEDMLLAVGRHGGQLVSINANSRPNFRPQLETTLPRDYLHHCILYLVKSSSGALLLIRRYVNFDEVTTHFKVYMLMPSLNEVKAYWGEIKSLGTDAIFVADGHGWCVQASNFPNYKPNSIYFAHHSWGLHRGKNNHDRGIYNLEDRSITGHYSYDESQRDLPQAVWIVPNLEGGDQATRCTQRKKSISLWVPFFHLFCIFLFSLVSYICYNH